MFCLWVFLVLDGFWWVFNLAQDTKVPFGAMRNGYLTVWSI